MQIAIKINVKKQIDLKNPIIMGAFYILRKLEDAGYSAYIVGGFVRDLVCGFKNLSTDIDITTSAEPTEIKKVFKHTFDKGIKYGTVGVLIDGVAYDVTTYRSEKNYQDNRHPESVVFTKEIIEDLVRRDFTINALILDKNYTVFDYIGGLSDIKNKQIKTIGTPENRFKEDALRLIRLIYFQTKLGFSIETNTKLSLNNLSYLVKEIHPERITSEFTKVFLNGYFREFINNLRETKVFDIIIKRKFTVNLLNGFANCLNVDEMLVFLNFFEKQENPYFIYTNKVKNQIKFIKKIVVNKYLEKDMRVNLIRFQTETIDLALKIAKYFYNKDYYRNEVVSDVERYLEAEKYVKSKNINYEKLFKNKAKAEYGELILMLIKKVADEGYLLNEIN